MGRVERITVFVKRSVWTAIMGINAFRKSPGTVSKGQTHDNAMRARLVQPKRYMHRHSSYRSGRTPS